MRIITSGARRAGARRTLAFLIALLASLWVVSCCRGDGDLSRKPVAARTEKLTVGEVTISYPPGLEAQAQEAAKATAEVVAPARDKFHKFESQLGLGNADRTAKRICELIGCPEHVDSARTLLSLFLSLSRGKIATLADIRLYTESEIKSSGGLKEGPVHLTYDPKEDKFEFEYSLERELAGGNATSLPKGFFPLLVKSDGTFRTGDKMSLAEYLAYICDEMVLGTASSIHEATETVLVRDLKLVHPFTRWFNEAVANWVMLNVAGAAMPDMERQLRGANLPGKQDEALKAKVNLVAWPQAEFSEKCGLAPGSDVSTAHYRFATEALDRLLRDQTPDALAKIIGRLKDKPGADTDTICAAIKDVTGKDFRAILLEYTPEWVRAGVKDGLPEALLSEAKAKIDKGEYAEAVGALSKLLEMTPSLMDAHLDLAWAMRKSGCPRPESECQIKLAAGLALCRGSCDLKGSNADVERLYVSARFLQMWDHMAGGQLGVASRVKQVYEELLKVSPDRADARAALAELEKNDEPAATAP